ncbi:helix-turn-helix domain-containing protein [Lactobacillus crispatus]|uniref:helix-turn-helix domain-containing protein n=2 Tax=Lactobacillus crispatus TaxID=47770 RepID=UPI002119C4BB|nr:helix-turn-helix transcriptional regulator [Lactobacillus crispatus]
MAHYLLNLMKIAGSSLSPSSNQQYSLPSFLVLSELSVDDSTSARVRSALTELLPSGEFTIDDVAKKLGYSKRTLQRKLSSENTTFQKQLNSTREVLALNYLQNTDMTTSDIAYLLGYQEFNSFLRAFSIWKGMSISEYREKMNK